MRVFLITLEFALAGCTSHSAWAPADTTAATHAVQLSQRCGALCLGDAGCSPQVAAGCFESIDCNVGSMLHRHNAPDLGTSQECRP